MIESRPGASWITVGWHPAGWCDAALFGDTLVVRVNQADVWRETVGPMRYPSIAAKRNGQIKVAGALQDAGGIDRVMVIAHGVVLNTNEHAYGQRPVRLVVEDDAFVVYAMDAPRTWIRLTLDPWTVTRHANPFAYGSSAGLLDVVSGMPIFAESILGGLVERDGLRFPQTRATLTAGQLAGPDAIAVLEAGQTTPTVVLRGPCYEPDLARAEDGTFIVAARTPSGASIVNGPPWPLILDVTPDHIPRFAKTYQPIGIGLFFDDPDQPSCHQGDHKVAQFYTLDRDDYALAQAEADRLNVPLLAYKDDHGLKPEDIPFGARAAVYCYPSPSRTVASTLDLIRLDCTRLRDAGIEIDLVVALYRQWAPGDKYSWSEQQALAVLAGVWDLAREFRVGALWGFARRRIYNGVVVDGVDRWPSFQEALRRLRAASGEPSAFPRRAVLTPPPVPPPPPPAPEPVPMPDPPVPVPDLPIIHSGPNMIESYRREVLKKHGVDPYPFLGPLPAEAWTKPTRAEVLTRLQADIAPTGDGFESLVLGHTDRGPDILGTWGWLNLDDARFATVAAAYKARGLSLVPCNVREGGYQGQHFDFTDNVPALRARLERVYQAGLIPMVNLQAYGEGEGKRTITLWRTLLPQIADLVTAAFLGWELAVDGREAGFSPAELDEMVTLFRQHCPDAVLGIEFFTPDGHEPITYDGRAVPPGEEAQWWWKHSTGRFIDVLMLEIGYHRADDEKGFVDDIAGAACRFHGPFVVRETWPDGTPVEPGMLQNWRGPDYGLNRVVMLFEYAAYLCWPSERKRARRELAQQMVPTLTAWGEG